MSIAKRTYPPSRRNPKGRAAWRVRWLDRGQHCSREFGSHADARAFEAHVIAASVPAPQFIPAPAVVQPQTHYPVAPFAAPAVQAPQYLAAQPPTALAPSADDSSPLLCEFWQQWIDNRRSRTAPSTVTAYELVWRMHIERRLGRYRLCELERNSKLLSDYMMVLAVRDPKTGKPRVGPSTRRKAYMILKAMFRTAMAWNLAISNPMDRIEERAPSQRRERDVVVFSAARIEQMRAALLRRADAMLETARAKMPLAERNLRDAALLSLLAYCGLRPAEALALTWGDVSLDGGMLWISSRNSDGVRREPKS